MRTDLAADFLAEMASNGSSPFVFALITGNPQTFLIGDRSLPSFALSVVVPAGGWGVFESTIQGTVSRSLSIGALNLRTTNLPAIPTSWAPGLSRMCEQLNATFPRVPVTVCQAFVKADGTVTFATLFAGYITSPLTFDSVRHSITVVSARENYLTRPVLKIFEDAYFEYMRRADIGTTLPLVFGRVRRAPGRVSKRGPVSNPVASTANSSTALLDEALAGYNSVTETFTLTFTQPETVAFTSATNTDDLLGDSASSPRVVYAQSFQTVGAQQLIGATLRLRSLGTGADFTALCYLCADSAGVPGAMLASSSRAILSSDNSYADRTFEFPPTGITGATTYWLVVRGWGIAAGGMFYWASASGGGFGSGHGKAGTYPSSDDYKQPNLGTPSITWNASRDAYDYRFALMFASTAYSIVGSVTGADGAGSTANDSTSTSGKLTVPAAAWKGVPAGGDVFTLKTAWAYGSYILFGQANAGNLGASSWLQRLYWDDEAIGSQGSGVVNLTSAPSALALDATPYVALGQAVTLVNAGVLKSAFFQLKKTGTPPGLYVHCEVFETDINAVPTGSALATSTLAVSALTTSLAQYEFKFAFTPVLMKAGRTYAFVLTPSLIGTAGNAVSVGIDTASAGPMATVSRQLNADWVASTHSDLAFRLDCGVFNAYHFNPDQSPVGWDATRGVPTLGVASDVAIPDAITVTADIAAGIVDDSGTITGTAFSSITIPDHVFRWLANLAGVPDSLIDLAGSFADAHARFGSLYRFNGVVQEQQTFDALFTKLGRECRCSPDWSVDKLQLNWLKDSSDAPAVTFTPSTIVADAESGLMLVEFEWSNVRELVNSIDARWSRDPHLLPGDPKSYRRSVHREDGASVVLFGRCEVPQDFFYDFVDTEDMATALADYALDRLSLPKRLGKVTAKLPLFALQKSDNVAFAL